MASAACAAGAVLCIPSSPNWYCSKVTDCNDSGLLAFGSRNRLVFFQQKGVDGESTFQTEYVATLNAHKERVAGLCFSGSNGALLASVGDDLCVNLTDVNTLTTTLLHDVHESKPTCVAWAQSNDVVDFVVSGEESGMVVACNIASKKPIRRHEGEGAVTSIAGSLHARHLIAIGYKSGVILMLDFNKGCDIICKLRNHDGEIQSLCWAPFGGAAHWKEDGDCDSDKLLASSSSDCTIKVWSMQRGIPLVSFLYPTNLGVPRWKHTNQNKVATWIALTWPARKPDVLISGSHSSVLLTWDLRSKEKNNWSSIGPKDNKNHTRTIFNVACFKNVACTISMDRQIMFWKIDSSCVDSVRLGMLPSLAGFVYSLSFSPVNPGLVALACGDSVLRTWNLTSATNPYDVTTFWQGIKAKVTALCWHPKKEGIVAFGTEEGRVGIYNVLSNKPPSIMTSFHEKIVYAVSWGPACPTQDKEDDPVFRLYSCGSGIIYVHDPSNIQKAAINFNKLLPNCSSKATKIFRTEISWNSNFNLLSIGNNDGTVEVYSTVDLKCLLQVSTQHKLVHCIRWHPEYTLSSRVQSEFRFCMAVATQDSTVHVHNFNSYLVSADSDTRTYPISVTTCDVQLAGHTSAVSSLSWNPHLDAQLATASFDTTVRVWDVNVVEGSGRVTACCSNHLGRVLCVEWNPLDPDVVFSGSEDFTVQAWKISEQDVNPSARVEQEVQKLQKKKEQRKKTKRTAVPKLDNSNAELSVNTENPDASSVLVDSLQKLLDERRKELIQQGEKHNEESEQGLQPEITLASNGGGLQPENGKLENSDVDGEENQVILKKVDDTGALKKSTTGKNGMPSTNKKKKKRNEKSLFPLTSALENRGKVVALDDCMALADNQTAGPTRTWGESELNLGVYSNRVDAFKLVKCEGDHHQFSGNLDYALYLEIWKGNISGALKMAAKNEQLSDWLVSLAVAVSPTFWSEMSQLYVKQLIHGGYPQKAVLYLLAQNKVHDAINVLKTHASYKEALILAKVRLTPNDPVIAELLDEWATQAMKDGNIESAAKCYLAAGHHEKAAMLLSQKNDPQLLRAGAYIASKFEDNTHASLYAHKCILYCMVDGDFATARTLIQQHAELKPYTYVLRVCQFLQEHFSRVETSKEFGFESSQLEEHFHAEKTLKDLTFESFKQMIGATRLPKACGSTGEEQPNYGNFLKDLTVDVEEWKTCLALFPALPVPQQESHIVPWISVMVALIVADAGKGKTAELVRRFVTIFTVLHKSANVPRMLQFKRLMFPDDCFGLDASDLEGTLRDSGSSTEDSTIDNVLAQLRAYVSLCSIHYLVDSEKKIARDAMAHSEKDSGSCSECVYRSSPIDFTAMVSNVLDEECAELSMLRARLAYTKVALASISASEKRAAVSVTDKVPLPSADPPVEQSEVSDTTEKSMILAEILADTLIACPGITVHQLQEECDRIEAEIARLKHRIQVAESYPDPLESAILLAEFCSLHICNCGCKASMQISKTVVGFGQKYSCLERQMAKFDELQRLSCQNTSELL